MIATKLFDCIYIYLFIIYKWKWTFAVYASFNLMDAG